MRNLKNLLYAFNVENIRQLDVSLHMDEYGSNKLLMKKFLKVDDGPIGVLLGNVTPDTSAPSKDPLLNGTLGGSLLGLNSSQTPLAASNSIKELGRNEVKKEEIVNKDGSEENPDCSEKVNTKTGKKSEEKTSITKKKKVNKEDESEIESFITNGQIIKRKSIIQFNSYFLQKF